MTEEKKQTLRITSSVSEILREEYGVGSKITLDELATALDVHVVLLNRIMDMDNWGYMMCARLARVFNTTDQYWWSINTQHQMTWGISHIKPEDLDKCVDLTDKLKP